METPEIKTLVNEAIHPEETGDFVELHGHKLPIPFLPSAREREIKRALNPILPRIPEFWGRFRSEKEEPMAILLDVVLEIGDEALEALPKVVATATGKDVEWVDNTLSTLDQVVITIELFKKFGKQEALGKLSGILGLSKKILASRSLTSSPTQPSSMPSWPATDSALPEKSNESGVEPSAM